VEIQRKIRTIGDHIEAQWMWVTPCGE
jgi:hypothetical protein